MSEVGYQSGDADDLLVLLKRVSAADTDAFKRLYDRTSAKLLGIILRICRDRDQANDILQEVYVRVWKKAAQYNSAAGKPITWLAAIARNAAIDEVRRVKTPDADTGGGQRVQPEDLADRLIGQVAWLEQESLRVCLDRVESSQRTCIMLAYCEGYSREELGLQFDRPVATIKTWLHRGLKSLKACMEVA